jgi:hypothetical protein
MAKIENAKAIVADRKTLDIDGKQFGPGSEVILPKHEVESLRKKGFLVDPDAVPVEVADGPTFTAEDGPSAKSE